MTNPNDPFTDPNQGGGGSPAPALRCIGVGRLVAIVPLAIHRGERNPYYKASQPVSYSNQPTRDRLVCDLLICDGQGFMYGGDPTKGLPDNEGPFPAPGYVKDMWITKQSLVDAIPEHTVGGGVVLARFVKVPTSNGNTVWNISKEGLEPGTPARAQAAAVYQAYKEGRLPTHTPSPKAAVQAPPTAGYTTPPAPNMGNVGVANPAYATTTPVQFPYGGAPSPTPLPPGYGQAAPVAGAQFPPQAAPVAAPAPVGDWTLTHNPPTGFESAWTSWSPEQRASVLAMQGVTAGTVGPLVPIAAGDRPTY